jgi:hypothetical protein
MTLNEEFERTRCKATEICSVVNIPGSTWSYCGPRFERGTFRNRSKTLAIKLQRWLLPTEALWVRITFHCSDADNLHWLYLLRLVVRLLILRDVFNLAFEIARARGPWLISSHIEQRFLQTRSVNTCSFQELSALSWRTAVCTHRDHGVYYAVKRNFTPARALNSSGLYLCVRRSYPWICWLLSDCGGNVADMTDSGSRIPRQWTRIWASSI